MNRQKMYSMKWKVIHVMLMSWLVPFCMLIGVFGFYLGSNHMGTAARSYLGELEFDMQICIERLNRAIAESRMASYDGEILRLRYEYLNGKISNFESLKGYQEYLNGHYQKNDGISSVILNLNDGENGQSSVIYNESSGGSYFQIRNYWNYDHEEIMEFAETLGTKVGFLYRRENLYLIRNLLNSRYEIQGTLIFILNKDFCLDSIIKSPMAENAIVEINSSDFIFTKQEVPAERIEKITQNLNEKKDYIWRKGRLYLRSKKRGDTYWIQTYMKMNDSVSMFPFYGYPQILLGMVVCFTLMLSALLHSFKKEVSDPVKVLCDGMQKIENGEFGYQIQEEIQNKEFAFLVDAVNKMSLNLEKQIKKIYQEEIALREARIIALQSHINPHFLNNTMEIINWQARLEGNEKVSNMIGALSKVLDAAMDRRKLPEITLREEMGYANSYLYIMKERLGKKLTVKMDIPEEVMDCPVPRLILQPVIENAIQYGVIPYGEGTVEIRGSHDAEYLYLEILNDGIMTKEDQARVERLLDLNYNTSKEPAGNLGIANVNQRLRILFGSPCGLNISEKDEKVFACLTIPLRNLNKNEQEITG